MRRNVLKAGRSSLAVSIPSSFVKSNNIRQGQELDVNCHGSTMTVVCGIPDTVRKKLDLRDLSGSSDAVAYDKILGAMFKQGSDSYELLLSSKEKADIIKGILRNGKLGMYEEPGPAGESTIVVNSPIRQYDEAMLEQMTGVVIKHLYMTLEEFLQATKAGKLSRKLMDELIIRDKTINDHCDICRRIINRTVLNYKSTSMYNFVDKCEKLGDTIKYLIAWSYSNQTQVKKNMPSLERIRDCLSILFSTITNFSVKKLSSFYSAVKQGLEAAESCNSKELYHYMKGMLGIISDSYSDIIVKNL